MANEQSRKLTKAEIVGEIYEQVAVSKRKIYKVLDLFFAEISRGLAQGKVIELRGFGTFQVVMRKSRQMRNPRTGELMEVEEHGLVTFRPGKSLREQSRNPSAGQ